MSICGKNVLMVLSVSILDLVILKVVAFMMRLLLVHFLVLGVRVLFCFFLLVDGFWVLHRLRLRLSNHMTNVDNLLDLNLDYLRCIIVFVLYCQILLDVESRKLVSNDLELVDYLLKILSLIKILILHSLILHHRISLNLLRNNWLKPTLIHTFNLHIPRNKFVLNL